jgi:hypothetical protein
MPAQSDSPIVLIRHASPSHQKDAWEAVMAFDLGRKEMRYLGLGPGKGKDVLCSDNYPNRGVKPPWLMFVHFKGESWIHLIASPANLISLERLASAKDLEVLAAWFEPGDNRTLARFFRKGCVAAELSVTGQGNHPLEVKAFRSMKLPKTFLKPSKTASQAIEGFINALDGKPRELKVAQVGLDLQLQTANGRPVRWGSLREVLIKYYFPVTSEGNPASVALQAAIKAVDLEGVRKAIAQGASLEFFPNSHQSPLEGAVGRWNKEGWRPIAQVLVDAGAAVDGFEWQNPLIFRHFSGHLDSTYEAYIIKEIEALLDLGADINAPMRDRSDRTVLHMAILFRLPEVVRFLIRKGASLTSRDSEGKTPVDRAKELATFNDYDPSVLTSTSDATDFEPSPVLPVREFLRQGFERDEDPELDLKKRIVRVVKLMEQAAKKRKSPGPHPEVREPAKRPHSRGRSKRSSTR